MTMAAGAAVWPVTSRAFKRAFDILVSVTALLVLSPLLAIVAVVVRMRLGTPVLFRQRRPGLDAVPFEILKFRSMSDDRDPTGMYLSDDARIGRIGRILRRTSIDELPELVNVVRGEMSIVGPRPLLVEYLTRYSPDQARRHQVRPGLTGLAQIRGRNTISWTERLALDTWYVDNQSFVLDLCIIAGTVKMVVTGQGVDAAPGVTMARFEGDRPSHT